MLNVATDATKVYIIRLKWNSYYVKRKYIITYLNKNVLHGKYFVYDG